MLKADAVIGLCFGDEAKSKVVHHLISPEKYTHCLRFCGGSNAGHTIYVGEDKVVTHSIPTGALQGIRSIIGPGCVVNERKFFEELDHLSKWRSDIHDVVKIARNCHVVTEEHLTEENNESKIGTTRQGIGPAYRDKYARTGIRAEDVPAFQDYLVDTYEEFYGGGEDLTVMCEGAQALFLDIDLGYYPFVTSSHCGVGGIINNGIAHTDLRDIYGISKCYDTYVGAKSFQDTNNPELEQLGDVGKEYGATTGRRRQVNYLNMDSLVKGCKITSTTQLIMNKVDILQELDIWKVLEGGKVLDLGSEEAFTSYVCDKVPGVEVTFSGSPYKI